MRGGEGNFFTDEQTNRVTLQHVNARVGYLKIIWRDALGTAIWL